MFARANRETRKTENMNMIRSHVLALCLSTCVSVAWMIALCAVVVSAGLLLTLPDDGAYWRAAMWASIGVAWVALVAGFVLQRKFVQRVRASAMLAKLDGELRSDFRVRETRKSKWERRLACR